MAHPARRRLVTLVLLVAATTCFVTVVSLRHGPPSQGDTVPLTSVTTDLSHGRLHAAAAQDSLPNPPGYALLISPLVTAFRSEVGSPTWCTTGSGAPAPSSVAVYTTRPVVTAGDRCGSVPGQPPWFRAQGLLGVLAWLVMAIGALALLRAAGSDTLGRQTGVLVFLAFLPAASSAIVQLYHPEDILSLGLALGGLAQSLRRRWVVAGLLFGLAFLSKQFAVLLLVPAVAAAPDLRARSRLLLAAATVFAAGILPFLAAAPRATLDNLSGFSAGGAVAGSTVLTLSGVTGSVASAVARDAPVLFASVLCLWAWRRFGRSLGRPGALVALTLACVGSRLVFESVIFPYYLLATSVMIFMVDMVARHSPYRSLAWCAAAAFFVAVHPDSQALDAWVTLALAALAVGTGLFELARATSVPADVAV